MKTIAEFFATQVGKIIIGGVIIAILLVTVKSCMGSREAAEQAKQDARSANATAETAKEVVDRVVEQADTEADIDDLVNDAAKEIENAETPKAARRAAINAICKLPAYQANPTCKND